MNAYESIWWMIDKLYSNLDLFPNHVAGNSFYNSLRKNDINFISEGPMHIIQGTFNQKMQQYSK